MTVLALVLLDRRLEDRRAGPQRAGERGFLGVDDRVDVRRVAAQFGVQGRHGLDRDRGQLVHEALLVRAAAAALGAGQQAEVPDAAAHDAAQHVAAALVGRQHPVLDQHDRAAHVIGDHAQGHVGLDLAAVALLGQLRGPVEDLPRGVDLVQVVHALQDGRHPLQAHPGVDVLGRQRSLDVEVVLGPELADAVLHEDQVPDLEEAVFVHRRAAVAAVVGPAVVVDLRARAARAGHAHAPVVVGQAAGLDPLFGQADLVPPDRGRLVVAVQDRGPQLALREAEAAVGLGPGQQLPGVPDRAFLEVVTERPVAEHLEERGVPGGLAHLVDVERAQALLHVRRPRPRRRLLAEQVRLERLHARDDEQHRGIIGDQGGRRHDGVPLLLEIGKEAAGDLCRLHQWPSLGRGSCLV